MLFRFVNVTYFVVCNKMLSYHRKTALQVAFVLAKSGRLELGLGDDVYGHYRSIFNQCDIIGL